MNFIINSKGIKGEITVPGDKSISHRSVIFGSIANGTTRVKNFLPSKDCICTVGAFRSLGVEIKEIDNGELLIKGKGLDGLLESPAVIDLGNSGTSLRLLTGLLTSRPFFSVLTGDNSLVTRPMKRVIEPLTFMGASIWARNNNSNAPLAIKGGMLHSIDYKMPVASAQVKSAVILAALGAEGTTAIYENAPLRDHTERMLRGFGGKCSQSDGQISLPGRQNLEAIDLNVPGDISSASFFIVAALIIKNSCLKIKNVGLNKTRTGIIDILKKMGGDITIENEEEISGEPVGDIIVRHSSLKGTVIDKELVVRAIDEIPVITVAAAFAEGDTLIKDASELRVKESDRIASMGAELSRLGVNLEIFEDGMRISGGSNIKGAHCKSYNDHRVAMSLAVLSLKTNAEISIDDTSFVDTSFPGFFKLLEKVNG